MSIAVSVVIPVAERVFVLATVLQYFELQDFPADRFEVIVVDDGSAENVEQTLAGRTYNFSLEIITQPNRGRAAARNSGLQRARGELIVFCDADRIPDPAFVSTHVSFHERYSETAAVGVPWDCFLSFETLRHGDAELMSTVRRFSRRPAYYETMCRLLPREDCTSPLGWAAFLVGNSSVRRSDVLAVGGFNEALVTWGIEHFELALRLVEERYLTVRFIHGAASYHVPHPRASEYFRAGIEAAVRVLADAPASSAILSLREFLFGRISLQQFESRYRGQLSETIAAVEPVFFRDLHQSSSVES